jgi:hypothetical protein
VFLCRSRSTPWPLFGHWVARHSAFHSTVAYRERNSHTHCGVSRWWGDLFHFANIPPEGCRRMICYGRPRHLVCRNKSHVSTAVATPMVSPCRCFPPVGHGSPFADTFHGMRLGARLGAGLAASSLCFWPPTHPCRAYYQRVVLRALWLSVAARVGRVPLPSVLGLGF